MLANTPMKLKPEMALLSITIQSREVRRNLGAFGMKVNISLHTVL
jgi:hypothetical protein